MERPAPGPRLVDQTGQPLAPALEAVLWSLAPRLKRLFPRLVDDDAVLTNLLEVAGRRIAAKQETVAIEHVPRYAWVVLRHAAIDHMRRSPMRVRQRTVPDGTALLDAQVTSHNDAATIERAVLIEEALDALAADDRALLLGRFLGYSAEDIARSFQTSPQHVNDRYSRLRQRLRHLLDPPTHTKHGRKRKGMP